MVTLWDRSREVAPDECEAIDHGLGIQHPLSRMFLDPDFLGVTRRNCSTAAAAFTI